jgi:raffinose/stachyose/melibiose transport system permease protein
LNGHIVSISTPQSLSPVATRAAAPTPANPVRRLSWLFVLPAIAVYAAILIYPMCVGLGFAFTNWNGLDPNYQFIGIANFRRLFHDPQVRSALAMTFAFAIGLALVQNVVGLGLAIALNSKLKLRQPLRLLFFIPVILTPLIVSFLWRYIFATEGPLNLVLDHLRLPFLRQNWLGESNSAIAAVLIVSSWQSIGLAMVIYLAGLQSVPSELVEAAKIDGANRLQTFWYVVLPMLAPAVTVTVVNSLITSMKVFDQIYVLTGGGPGYATETMSTLIYKTAFQYSETGYGSAISVVFTFVVAGVVLSMLRVLRRKEIDNA